MLNELWRMTAHQVKEGNFKKAVLAVGACEAHGQHLAEGCDTIVSYKLGKAIADELGSYCRRSRSDTAPITIPSPLR